MFTSIYLNLEIWDVYAEKKTKTYENEIVFQNGILVNYSIMH